MKKSALTPAARLGLISFLLISISIGLLWEYQEEWSSFFQGGSPHEHTYICPMHPQIKSKNPSSCLICGMDLVPYKKETITKNDHQSRPVLENQRPAGHAEFQLSMPRQQMIGVKLGTAEIRKLHRVLRVPGRVAFDPELYTVQSEYLEALKLRHKVRNSPIPDVKENTRHMIQSSKTRLKVLGLSDAEISRLARRGRQSEGLLVSGAGHKNWIYADIFEVDLPYIKEGLAVQVTANFLKNETLKGRIVSVDRMVDSKNRTAKVRIKLFKTKQSVRPGAYVSVKIFIRLGTHLSIPLAALMDTGKETFVFVSKDGGKFEPRKVAILFEAGSYAAVEKGLLLGEKIVIDSNFLIDSESRLEAVIQNETSGSGHAYH